MKHFYEAPSAEVIDLAAMESIAVLNGHPHEAAAAAKDDGTPDVGSLGVGEGHPF